MKHLFIAHSHTVFLTAVGVIEKLNLDKKDVVFMYTRHYKNSLNFPYKYYDYSDEVEESYHIFISFTHKHYLFSKKQHDKTIKIFDDFIKEQIGEEYCLYLPHLQTPAYQIMATNDKCVKCAFLQEGARIMKDLARSENTWYFTLYNKIVLRNETRMWKCYRWFPDKNAPFKKEISAYVFDKEYYGDIPSETTIIKWPNVKLHINLNTQYPIFALEGAVELGQISKKTYMNAVNNLIKTCGKEYNYIKFHPAQTESIKKEYLKLFKDKGLKVIELPMDIPFELIVSSFKGLTVCGFGSSLLFYAKVFGHNVISHENELLTSFRYRFHVRNVSKL